MGCTSYKREGNFLFILLILEYHLVDQVCNYSIYNFLSKEKDEEIWEIHLDLSKALMEVVRGVKSTHI